jgi:hypothetical protein
MTKTAHANAIRQTLPFLDLKAQFASIRSEILEAVTRTLESQRSK